MNLAIQRLTMPGSSCMSWKSAGAGGVRDQFPAGLRVLVVDDDPTCLMILEKMLKNCNYEATKCNRAEIALSFLRGNKNGFDIVLSDVHMPDMDGFKLLEHIGIEMDLPVIMMSADDSNSVVMKGVTHGACDYLIKPVRIEALRNIWQHVVRRWKHEWKDFKPLASANNTDQLQKVPEDLDCLSSASEADKWKNAKRRKDSEDEVEERDESSSLKKPRVVWSIELHQQFVVAVNQLGIDKAVPKKILELMNVPGLTRENVASHLQKYRLYLRRLSRSQHLGTINTLFMGNPDAGYRSLSSLNGLDLCSVAAAGQLPGQCLATLQAVALGGSNNSKSLTSVPVVDQRNIFSFENPNLRYGELKTQRLIHGIPTSMEPKQLVGLHKSQQHSFGGVNSQVLIPMGGQCQSQSNIIDDVLKQPISPNGMLTHGLGTKVLGGGFVPGNDIFKDLNQSRAHDQGLQDIGVTFKDTSSYSSGKKMGDTVVFSAGKESGNHHNALGDNTMRAKAKNLSRYPEQYNQDDLLTAILKQQQHQDGFGQPGNEFGFDKYALEDLPV